MKFKLSTIALALGVLALPATAHAYTYRVVQTQYQSVICRDIVATGPVPAFQKCMIKWHGNPPAWAVVITTYPHCHSTHRLERPGAPNVWAFDRRLIVVRPECPAL